MMIDSIFFIVIGIFAGLLSGLLGLGGGVIIVPGLLEWIQYKGFDTSHAMQLSVGTALGAMMIITLVTGWAHQKLGNVRWDLVARLAPGTVLGVMVGVQLIDYIPSASLKKLFATVLLLIAFQLLFFPTPKERDDPLLRPWMLTVAGVFVGMFAGMLGLGGGLFIIPLLIYNGIPIRQCSSTAIWCTLPTVSVGAMMAIWTGLNESDLPGLSLGYLYWPAGFAIGLCSLISAPVGVYLAMRMPKLILQKFFALVICLIAIRLLTV